MNDFKNPENAGPNALMLGSIIILIGTLIFYLIVRPPDTNLNTGHGLQRRNANDQIAKAKAKGQEARLALEPMLWQGGNVQVTADILSMLNSEANHNGLILTSFSPDNQKDLTGFQELSYTVQVSGPYPQVRSMLRSLDGGKDRVALGSIQIAVAPNSASAVQATISLSAYLVTDQTLLPAGGANHA